MVDFTIIIPHKNIPNLLKRCIDSIPLKDNIQTIIVDDNSDSSIVDFGNFPGLNRKNIKCIFTKEGKGAGYARNVGLKHAEGKWILFADSDDFFTDELEMMMNKYRDSLYDVILFQLKIINSKTLKESEERDGIIKDFISRPDWDAQKKLSMVVIPSSKFVKRELITNHDITFEEIRFANDTMFGIKLAIYAKNVNIDNQHCIYNLTFRDGSLTTIYTKESLYCRLNCILRCNKLLKENNLKHLMNQVNKEYLKRASQFGKTEVLYIAWILFLKGFLFYRNPEVIDYKYYQKWWYFLIKYFLIAKW